MASCMNLMRRLPPKENQKNLTAICELIGDEELKDEVYFADWSCISKKEMEEIAILASAKLF